jgi:hypothetical protein
MFSPAAVVAATVNVLCELAIQNPKDYLLLAPQLFHLLTTSTNNWMLIKIIKLVCPFYALSSAATTTNIPPVRRPLPARTSSRQETPAAHNRAHLHHARHIPPLRMRSHLHHRGNAADSFRRLSGKNVRHETRCFYPGFRSEPCVSGYFFTQSERHLIVHPSEVHCPPCNDEDRPHPSSSRRRVSRHDSCEYQRPGHQHPHACS